MKKTSKLLAFALACVAALSLTACGGKNASLNSSTDIQIYFWQSGYGSDWMEKIVAGFNTAQTEYHATLEKETNAATIIKSLDLGKNNTYDLYFTMLNTTMYDSDFASLDDVLQAQAFGETETVESKYYDYLLRGVENADGTHNFLTYGMGWIGIAYNTDVIDGEKYELPRTTDELNLLTKQLALDGVTPWIFYNDQYNNGYWNYVLTAWEVQYDGEEYFRNTTMGLKGEGGVSPDKEALTAKDGRYEALKVLESLVTPDTVHSEVTSTNFTKVQSLFLRGEAAMSVNGSWLLTESQGKANVSMMKMPVISSIVSTLQDSGMTDETLSQIVAEIDGGAETSELCGAEDFARIKKARNLMYNNSCEQYVFVPKYSSSAEGAKAFLRYFYSDEATAEFMKSNEMPASVRLADESKFDKSTLGEWGKRMFEFCDTATAVTDYKNKASLYIDLSINHFVNLTYAQSLCATNVKDRKNADALWNSLVAKVNENWSEWTH